MSAGGGLHGLPRPETVEGKLVRDILVPSPGWRFVELDLSQAELRVLAWLSRDPVMVDTYRRGIDMHQRTAEGISERVWHIPPTAVQSKHRSIAKIMNLSLVYGRGDAALAAEITAKSGQLCTRDEARDIKTAILGQFSVAAAWMDSELAFVREHGYARTFLDGQEARRRALWSIAAPGDDEGARKLRSHAERVAKNNPVQGTTSDLVLRSLIATVRWILESGVRARLVLSVHDSLLLEAHPDDVPLVVQTVRGIMQGFDTAPVPLVADVKVGPSAGSLEKVKGL